MLLREALNSGVDRAYGPLQLLIQLSLSQVSPGPQVHGTLNIASLARQDDDLRFRKFVSNRDHQ